jgi:Predicted membrane protein (DUF2142)
VETIEIDGEAARERAAAGRPGHQIALDHAVARKGLRVEQLRSVLPGRAPLQVGRHGGSQSAYSSPMAAQTRSVEWAPPALVAAFLVLCGAAWLMGNAPGGGTDEPAHYVKAVGVGGGELYGRPLEITEAERRAFLRAHSRAAGGEAEIGVTSKTLEWQARTSREFELPAGLVFPRLNCTAARPDVSAACLDSGPRSSRPTSEQTYTGTYQPYLYLPAGLLMRATDDPQSAVRLGRLGDGALSLALLAVAGLLLWDPRRGGLSLLGLIAAVTPAVVFSASIINPSGPEIAAAVCFTAALIRLLRGGPQRGWIWAALAASGTVLALSRSFGPLFVVFLTLASAGLRGSARVRGALTGQRRPALAVVVVIALAAVAGVYWELAYQPHPSARIADIAGELGPSIGALPVLAREAVGVFGNLDTRMPDVVHVVWAALVLCVAAVALVLGEQRERWALIALGAFIIAATVLLSAAARQTGFQFQGRYILPLAVAFPLWAGEIVSAHGQRLGRPLARTLLIGIAGAAAGVHLFAWYFNARRFAIGTDGPWNFIPDAEWSPPGGWWPWLLMAVAASASYVGAGVVAARALK